MTATPGTFCDAIVTTNKGNATPISAPTDRLGVTQTGFANSRCTASMCNKPCAAAMAMPSAKAHITA